MDNVPRLAAGISIRAALRYVELENIEETTSRQKGARTVVQPSSPRGVASEGHNERVQCNTARPAEKR